MAERDDILRKMQELRIHAAGASKAEKARLNRDYKVLWDRLQELNASDISEVLQPEGKS
jgi:hypothetical protein